MVNGGMVAFILEDGGSNLAAQVAINAGVVDEKIAGNVVGIRSFETSHN
jgi:hypothetical protein